MATYGLFLPPPALAQPSCVRIAHEYCNANWQDYYSSREECLNAEIANCSSPNAAAINAAGNLAPALRDE
jgi:hypothetical protein